MREIRPDRVAIYVRWSTDDQSEGTTLETQLEGCRHYALSQGWTPRHDLTYVDDGYSGASLQRPALTRLRQAVSAGLVDCVVVFKVDRLSRNIVDAVDLVLGEWRETCYFKSAREPIDTGSDLGRVVFSILAMFADFERSQIRERTQSGKLRRIAEGRQLHGEPAFGYGPAGPPGQWAEEPAEAAVVRRIFGMAASGQSAATICRQLNGEGLRTRAGKAWSIRGVLWLLHNRTYIGEAVYGRTQLVAQPPGAGPKTRRIRRPAPLVVTPTRAAPALVDPELFDRAQATLAQHRVARSAHGSRGLSSRHLLVGLARCRCGAALVAKQQRRSACYVCSAARDGRCPHAPGQIPREKADSAVLTQFLALLGDDFPCPGRLEAAVLRAETDSRALAGEHQAVQRALERLETQEERLLQAARSGEIDLSDLRALRGNLEAERRELGARSAILSRQLEQAGERGASLPQRLMALPARDRIALLTPRELRDLLHLALAGPICLHKPKGTRQVALDLAWKRSFQAAAPMVRDAPACTFPDGTAVTLTVRWEGEARVRDRQELLARMADRLVAAVDREPPV